MRVELFDYHLPPELIAQKPAQPRRSSRLMVVDCESDAVEHLGFKDLDSYLEEGDCLVFNRSRVRQARLIGHKVEGGGKVEILLLRGHEGGIWEALAKPARRLRRGTEVIFGQDELKAEILEKGDRGWISIRLFPSEPNEVEALVERLGEVPLPPYIKERLVDTERYQTVYAAEVGSTAAPTAGLHFDLDFLKELREKGLRTAFIRLDVGLDTFRPIHEEEVEDHRLHSEEVALDGEACEIINATRVEGRRVIAVGTTVVRALESAVSKGEVVPLEGSTDLFIYPGFEFKVVDGLVTNFHLPRSSLLLLVCAFAGRELVMSAYGEAVAEEYRFLSFGDACFFHYKHGWSGTLLGTGSTG
jgi:S-adenosylmethionine:tRNA ribosyltransferase-isomerase